MNTYRQSVSLWCAKGMTLKELCRECQAIGLAGIDLVQPEDFPVLRKAGLEATLVFGPVVESGGKPIGKIPYGFNRPEHHEVLIEAYRQRIEEVSKAGYRNLVCFSGNREGMGDEEGLGHCVTGLQQLLPHAEKAGVILMMEGLSSKDHPDYMYDKTAWGAELCQRLSSESFQLLYDIYHMQRMEGDMVHTLRENARWIGHIHTAGVPGRGPIGEDQEIRYPVVMKALRESGFSGVVAHEFPFQGAEGLEALREAVSICDPGAS